MMPAPSALRHVYTIAWDRHIENNETAHRFGVLGSKGECNWPAPVMADEEEAVELQVAIHELPNIRSNSFLVIAGGGPGGVTKTPQVGCNDEVLLRQKRNHVAP